jgi:putative Mg2+ transporter-C (MgtC) family protein
MISWEQIVLRIVVGAVLGGLVGLEREMRGQAAGFRTHTLVAMGSTLFTLVSIYGFEGFFGDGPAPGEPFSFDPSRVAAQIVVGIGFLGAGAIMRHGTSVKGLTTAASLWVVAAMGLAVGTGFWVGAITVSLLLLIVLRGLRPTENLLVKWVYPDEANLTISIDAKMMDSARFIEDLEEAKIIVHEISSVRTGQGVTTLTLAIRLTRHASAQEVVGRISALGGVTQVAWER